MESLISQTKLAYVFFFEGIVRLETKNMVLVLLMRLDGRRDLPPPCAKRKKSFAVEISQVALSGRSGEFGVMIWLLWTC